MVSTNGRVHTVHREGNTIYLGGKYSYVGTQIGLKGSLVMQPGEPGTVREFPKIGHPASPLTEGTVNSVISDGKEGWFVAGYFNSIGGVARRSIAHLRADLSVDTSFAPYLSDFSGDLSGVGALALKGDTLVLAGSFHQVNNTTQRFLAAVNATNGKLLPWYPEVGIPGSGYLGTMCILGDTVYVAGYNVPFANETSIGAFSLKTGQPASLQVKARNYYSGSAGHIMKMIINKGILYFIGQFDRVNDVSHPYMAAVNLATAQVLPWDPNPAPHIAPTDIAAYGDEVFIPLDSRTITVGGQPRRGLAVVDAQTGQAKPWFIPFDPRGDGEDYFNPWRVEALTAENGKLYVAGSFLEVSGKPYRNMAVIDLTTRQLADWAPNPDGKVERIVFSGNRMYLKGDIKAVGGEFRNNAAAVDALTGKILAWDPAPNDTVSAIAVHQNTVYLGGNFTALRNTPRSYLAAVDASTGLPTSWDPKASGGRVLSLAVSPRAIYAGGAFYGMGGESRSYLAAIDPVTGKATAWNPRLAYGGTVRAILLSDNALYAGGDFYTSEGNFRKHAAAFDLTTGAPTSWDPTPNNAVWAMAAAGQQIYLGGAFTSLKGVLNNRLGAVDAASGQPKGWNANLNGTVHALAVSGETLYAGGSFTSAGGQSRERLVALHRTSGAILPWSPGASHTVRALHAVSEALYVSGDFTRLSGKARQGFAALGKRVSLAKNYVSGLVYHDSNGNCQPEPGEKRLAGMIMVARPGNFFGITDSTGRYRIAVDTGRYTVSQLLPEEKGRLVKQNCPAGSTGHEVVFNDYFNTTAGKDFANTVTLQPYLQVQVSSQRRRRCFASPTTVSYQNLGSVAVNGVKVYVELPPHVRLISASLPYTIDEDEKYVFSLGTLTAGQQGKLSLKDSVVCNDPDIRGLTQCTKVWITPKNASVSGPGWDQSTISLKAVCLEKQFVRLGIYNDGTGAMADSSTYRIYVDAQLAFTRRFKLASGDSLILRVPGNGRTVRMEADQAAGHPTKQSSSISLEACGTGTGGRVSKGFVAQLPPDDEEPDVDIECLPIIDSYDPNDKLVQPIGTTADYYTGTGKPLRYTLRFQNTGTDYAYTVTVVDTLSEHLDISTLEVGAVSHPYQFTITGKGRPVLTWTFNGINLPDSSRDRAASNGLIQFAIRPKAELPLKTRIENFADIFFDYNPPVRTNTVLNTIYDVPLVVEQGVRLDPGMVIAMPVVTDFSPRAGMAGTVVSITGTNFDSVAANNKVTFNGVDATVTQATPTVLTVVVPPGSVEGKIRVTTAYGVALSHTDFTLLPTALEKSVLDNSFTLHPNPVTEYCILEFAQPTNRVVSIQAYNELGQQVLYQSIAHRTMQREKVYFGNLPKGIYLLVVKTDQEIFTRKVVFL